MSLGAVTHQTSPNLTNFSLPLLYRGLPRDHIDILESAFALQSLQEVDKADQAFSTLPDELRLTPAAIIGRANYQILQTRFKDAYGLLNVGLATSEAENWDAWATLLTRLLLANATIMLKGSFVPARQCMSELRQLFRDARYEDLDAIKVVQRCPHLGFF